MGSHAVASKAGAYAKFTFTGKLAWVGIIKSRSCGYMDVYVDGVRKARVNLYSSATQFRQQLRVATFATSGTHTVVLKAVGAHQAGSIGNNVYADSLTVALTGSGVSRPSVVPRFFAVALLVVVVWRGGAGVVRRAVARRAVAHEADDGHGAASSSGRRVRRVRRRRASADPVRGASLPLRASSGPQHAIKLPDVRGWFIKIVLPSRAAASVLHGEVRVDDEADQTLGRGRWP